MSKITEVTISFGFTKNIGNYESIRADVCFGATLEQGETCQQVIEKLEKMCKAEVKRIITGKIEKREIETEKEAWEDLY